MPSGTETLTAGGWEYDLCDSEIIPKPRCAVLERCWKAMLCGAGDVSHVNQILFQEIKALASGLRSWSELIQSPYPFGLPTSLRGELEEGHPPISLFLLGRESGCYDCRVTEVGQHRRESLTWSIRISPSRSLNLNSQRTSPLLEAKS